MASDFLDAMDALARAEARASDSSGGFGLLKLIAVFVVVIASMTSGGFGADSPD